MNGMQLKFADDGPSPLYEPVFDISIPGDLAGSIDSRSKYTGKATRKVVIIDQAWPMRWAERNVARLAAHLVRSANAPLVLSGDYAPREQFPRPPILGTSPESLLTEAEQSVLAGRMPVMNYLAVAFPELALAGVGDDHLLANAQNGRSRRLRALEAANSGGSHVEEFMARIAYELERVKRANMSPDLLRAQELLKATHSNGGLSRLTDLAAFAEEVKVDLRRYPAIRQLARLLGAERRTAAGQAFAELHWLKRAVVSRLLGARLQLGDPSMKALFNVHVRRIVSSVDPDVSLRRIWQSDRPLAASADQAWDDLRRAVAHEMRENKNTGISAAGVLLDLAAAMGLNDARFRQIRRRIGAYIGWRQPLRRYLEELDLLRTEFGALLGRAPVDRALVELDRDFGTSTRLLAEELNSSEAQLAIRRAPSLATIIRDLGALGACFNESDQEMGQFLDSEAISGGLLFYTSTVNLSRVIASGVVEQMEAHHADAAILLCGGFHSREVQRKLEAGDQFTVSIVTPQLTEQHASENKLDLKEMEKGGMRGTNITFHTLKRSLDQAVLGAPSDPSSDSMLSDHKPTQAREWARLHGGMAAIERQRAAENGRINHECRVCARAGEAFGGARYVVCARTDAPNVMLRCALCDHQYICLRCAGRREIAIFPGHGLAEAKRFGLRCGLAVCNVHDEPLTNDEEGTPFMIHQWGAGLPGHSWFT